MAAAGGCDDGKPGARVKRDGGDRYETYDAGMSESTTSGELIVGWGAVVRARLCLRRTRSVLTCSPSFARSTS